MLGLEQGWYTDLDGSYWRSDRLKVGGWVVVNDGDESTLSDVEDIDWNNRKALVGWSNTTPRKPIWVRFTRLEYYNGGRVDRRCTKNEEIERLKCLLKRNS